MMHQPRGVIAYHHQRCLGPASWSWLRRSTQYAQKKLRQVHHDHDLSSRGMLHDSFVYRNGRFAAEPGHLMRDHEKEEWQFMSCAYGLPPGLQYPPRMAQSSLDIWPRN